MAIEDVTAQARGAATSVPAPCAVGQRVAVAGDIVCAGHRARWVSGGEAEPQVVEFGAVGYQVQFGDLAVGDGEPEHAQRLVQVPYCVRACR